MTLVAYYRVSTAKQGLGLEAQRAAVQAYAQAQGLTIAAEYTDIQTGKGADALERRPNLAAALKHAKRHKATLCVAKLDRLARDVHFISGLMSQKVRFMSVEHPSADPFMLHIYAAVAEQERLMISQRTIAGLQAAKARGTVLGNATLAQANADAAAARDAALRDKVMPLIGLPSRTIADRLNGMQIAAPRGGAWSHVSAQRMMSRLGF